MSEIWSLKLHASVVHPGYRLLDKNTGLAIFLCSQRFSFSHPGKPEAQHQETFPLPSVLSAKYSITSAHFRFPCSLALFPALVQARCILFSGPCLQRRLTFWQPCSLAS